MDFERVARVLVNYQINYHIAGNFDGGNFDGYRLFKYLTETILMDAHCLLVNAVTG